MATYHIDQIDQKILSFLVNNARMPFLEIARECGVSGAAIHQRVKRLETNGVITGSRLLVKPQALGLNVCAFISVTLSEADKYPEVVANLKKIAEIVECHFVTGKAALLLKAYCFDNDHLMEILINTIQNIPYIQSTETTRRSSVRSGSRTTNGQTTSLTSSRRRRNNQSCEGQILGGRQFEVIPLSGTEGEGYSFFARDGRIIGESGVKGLRICRLDVL